MKAAPNREMSELKFPADTCVKETKPFYSRPVGPIGGVTLFVVLYCVVFWYLIEDTTIWGEHASIVEGGSI